MSAPHVYTQYMNAKRGVEDPRTYTYTHTPIRIYTRTSPAYLSDRRVTYTLAHSSPELIDRFPSYQRFSKGTLVSG